jgi:hypothetical protein
VGDTLNYTTDWCITHVQGVSNLDGGSVRGLFVLAVVISLFVALPLFITVVLADGAAQASCPQTGCRVSSDPRILAQDLMTAYDDGRLRDTRAVMITNEIEPMAAGTATPECSVDVRVLQVMVLLLERFASVAVSDLGRPCAGMSLDCPGSAHCSTPDRAVDIVSVGGEPVDGYSSADAALLRFLDPIVPRGTAAGQSQCRAQHDQPAITLANITRFPDACTHQHLDFHATTAPLRMAG